MTYNSPKGTSDYFGEDIKYRNFILKIARELFDIYNYSEIITPHFEYSEVFARGIGENSEIVQKEMFNFFDKKGRSLTLRPEGTASIVRAVIENKLYLENLPLKLFYIGSMFRYERPQKGRMREFVQIGVEAIGSDNPALDAEIIWLLNTLFEQIGFKNLVLHINNIGCLECRQEYLKALENYLKPFKEQLCPDCVSRVDKNTLRVFDCKVSTCKEILKNSPKIDSYLCSKCKAHFEKVVELLDVLGINYFYNQGLVRGFDYYTRTVFEIVSKDIKSAQNALGGGGRYDNLIEEFGGPKLSSTGFAIGLERTVLLMKRLNIEINSYLAENKKVYVISMDTKFDKFLFEVLKFLRDNKVICDTNFNIKNISKEIKLAKEKKYNFIIIVGENEVNNNFITIKNLNSFSQEKFNWLDKKTEILNFLKN